MDYLTILWAFLILLGIGAVLGLGLFLSAKFLSVKEDERIAEVTKHLPGANCGNCGFPGCGGFAEAIVSKKEDTLSKCKVGKKDANFQPILDYLKEHPDQDGTPFKTHI